MKYRIGVVTGISSSGKTTLVEQVIALPGVKVATAITTRGPRVSDMVGDYDHVLRVEYDLLKQSGGLFTYRDDGINGYGFTNARFEAMLADQENFYIRSLTPEILEPWHFAAPGQVCFIHLASPSIEEARRRMRVRGNMTEAEIENRFRTEKDWDRQILALIRKGLPIHILPPGNIEETFERAKKIIFE